MSLLLGAVGKSHVVVMADGISINATKDKSRVERRDLQKVFASKSKPFVLAHHGLNTVGAIRSDTLLPDLIENELERVWSRGLNECLARTIETLDSAVSQALKATESRTAFAVWLAGLWPCTSRPEIAEVIWHSFGPRRVRLEVKAHGEVVWAGSGMKFVSDIASKPLDDKYSADKVPVEPAEYSMEFLKRLYAKALERQKQAGEELFGGQTWMALITEHGVDLGKL
jgi:hypothetical protein